MGKRGEAQTAAKLPPKQRRFVQEHLVDLNATQAAIRAGYSAKTADVQGPRLLGNVRIQEAIQEAMSRREKRTEITADRVLNELAKIAFSDLTDFVEFGPDGIKIRPSDKVDGAVLSEVSEMITKGASVTSVKLHSKMKALELLCKHLGLAPEKHQLSGPNGGPIEWVDLVKVAQSDGTGGTEPDS